MYVSDILKTKGSTIVSLGPQQTVAAAARVMHQHRIGAVLVQDPAGDMVGVLSERDIVAAVSLHGGNALAMTVRSTMQPKPGTCAPDDSISDLMVAMTESRQRHLPVIQQGDLIGIVSIGDVVKHRLLEMQREADTLRDYVQTVA